MYCRSCRTRLSPKDKSCPSCGQKVSTTSHDLGSGSATDADLSRSYPLPPARSWDADDPGASKSQSSAPSAATSYSQASPKAGSRKAKESRPASSAKSGAAAAADEEGSSRFALQPDEIRRLVAEQPELIEDGLRAHTGADGERVGAHFATAVGEIDLLARDSAGAWVVVQVAEPDEGKELVADLLQRMGWVRKHLSEAGQEVRAIVLLESVPEELGYAASAVADSVEFKLYHLSLAFHTVEP